MRGITEGGVRQQSDARLMAKMARGGRRSDSDIGQFGRVGTEIDQRVRQENGISPHADQQGQSERDGAGGRPNRMADVAEAVRS